MKSRSLLLIFSALLVFCFVVTSCSKSSKEKPALIEDKDELWKIKGKLDVANEKFLKAEFYNGTAWTLTDIDIEVLRPEGTSNKMLTRRFRLNVCDSNGQCFRPFKNGMFTENIGDFLQGVDNNDTNAFAWSVLSAHGFRE